MKAPDKIYLHPDFEGSQTPSVFWSIEKRGSHPEECVEYIRKDALMEWVKANLQDRDNWNEKSAADAFWETFDKLNSM